MSYFIQQVPHVVVKPKKMHSYWSPRMKALAVVLALVVYVYLLLLMKNIYAKTKRLDKVMDMVANMSKSGAVKTEKQILSMHAIDENLAVKMDHLNDMFEDY